MTVPVAYWIFINLFQAIKFKKFSILIQTDDEIFVWSIVCAAVVHFIIYSSYGAVSIRVLPLAFPFVLLVLPRSSIVVKLNKSITSISVFLLALTSVVGFVSYAGTILPDFTPSDLGNAALLIPDQSTILADAGIFGLLQINGANSGRVYNFSWPDSQKYVDLVNPTFVHQEDYQYFIPDKSNKPFITSGWVFMEPWLQNLSLIENNPRLGKVYDSDAISVYTDINDVLPKGQEIQSQPVEGILSIFGNFLRLLLAFLIVFSSGGLFILLLRKYLPFDIGGPLIFTCLSFITGIGLITIAGYLSNFTPMGLDNISWVMVVFIVILITLVLINKKSMFPIMRLLRVDIIWGFSLMIVWLLLATTVSYIRTSNSEFVEFFVMKDVGANAISVNVISELRQSENFELSYSVEGGKSESRRVTLDPAQVFQQDIIFPESAANKIVHLYLETDERKPLELHFLYQP